MISAPKICGRSHIRAGLSGYIAEMYSHLISRQLGLPEYIHDNSVAYIASWLKVLRGDKTALLSAASKAQAAFEYVQAFQQVETPVAIAA